MSDQPEAAELAAARVRVAEADVLVASVHAIAKEVSSDAVAESEHLIIKRPALRRAPVQRHRSGRLAPVTQGAHSIVGGGWNTSLLFDTTSPADCHVLADPASSEPSDHSPLVADFTT
jgi:hypothetical protein